MDRLFDTACVALTRGCAGCGIFDRLGHRHERTVEWAISIRLRRLTLPALSSSVGCCAAAEAVTVGLHVFPSALDGWSLRRPWWFGPTSVDNGLFRRCADRRMLAAVNAGSCCATATADGSGCAGARPGGSSLDHRVDRLRIIQPTACRPAASRSTDLDG